MSIRRTVQGRRGASAVANSKDLRASRVFGGETVVRRVEVMAAGDWHLDIFPSLSSDRPMFQDVDRIRSRIHIRTKDSAAYAKRARRYIGDAFQMPFTRVNSYSSYGQGKRSFID